MVCHREMNKKYFFGQDNSCHWYIVDADSRVKWEEWLDLDEDNPEAWDVPIFAKEIGVSLSLVEFENPEIFK